MLIGVILTSLKVVNIADSFLAETNLSATLRRNIDNLVRSDPRLPPVGVPIEMLAFIASSLVIRPSFPVPETVDGLMFFSSNIFLAAGDGVPEAYDTSAAGAAFTGSSFLTSGLAVSCFGASCFGASSFLSTDAPLGFAPSVSIRQTT